MAERVIVVGGGLAGVSAALRLADAGCAVTLLESRPRLGGRATSFARNGLAVDNGQHVFLRCCTAYREFLQRIGAVDRVALQPRLDLQVLRPGHAPARLHRTPMAPAPLHLAQSLLGYRHLRVAQRMAAAGAAAGLRFLDPADLAVDRVSFGAYLRRAGQSTASIDRFWSVIGTATLNAAPDDASLALAAKVFRTGLLERADAADIGWATAPLGELHDRLARRALAAAGVEVITRTRVRAVLGSTVTAARPGARAAMSWQATAVVLAVPHRDAFTIAPELAASSAAAARTLGSSAIVNVHLVLDRRVTDRPLAAAVDSPVHWLFDRTESSGIGRQQPRAQYLALTVSAADALLREPSRELVTRMLEALRQLLPAAAAAEPLDAWTTKEAAATFRQAPGSAAARAGVRSGPPGLWLAGAWTATGWPDTMESAVRSGVTAADAVLADTATRTETAA